MRRLLIISAVLAAALTTVSTASAAVISSRACNRYGPGLAGKKWVPAVATGGFGPSEALKLTWSDSSLAGFAQSDSLGRLFAGVFMPTAFITTSGPRERTFDLSAFDTTTGAKAGFGRVRFVRVGFDFQSRAKPHQVTRYGLWGGPAGRKVWLHFYFGGAQRRLVYMGRANKPCGVVHKRMQVLPTRSRYGKWTVYATNAPRGLSSRAIRRRDYLASLSFTVFLVRRHRASAAAVR